MTQENETLIWIKSDFIESNTDFKMCYDHVTDKYTGRGGIANFNFRKTLEGNPTLILRLTKTVQYHDYSTKYMSLLELAVSNGKLDDIKDILEMSDEHYDSVLLLNRKTEIGLLFYLYTKNNHSFNMNPTEKLMPIFKLLCDYGAKFTDSELSNAKVLLNTIGCHQNTHTKFYTNLLEYYTSSVEKIKLNQTVATPIESRVALTKNKI